MNKNETEDDSNIKKKIVADFYKKIQYNIEELPPASIKNYTQKLAELKNYPLTKNQSLYLLDWQNGKIIYHKGIENLLGYDTTEINIPLITNCIHPNDINIAYRLLKGSVELATETPTFPHQDLLVSLTYRMRKKDGNYIKVLRQSNVFHASPEGKMLSNFSILTDISFIDTSNRVDWKFEGHNIDDTKFKQVIYNEYQDFFSQRELSIIQLISQKHTSRKIAEKLYISKHTVDTHRKNILNKSNCKNAEELLNFCKKNGIL
jgi:DNA-binding CsgD family transcriptional regulator